MKLDSNTAIMSSTQVRHCVFCFSNHGSRRARDRVPLSLFLSSLPMLPKPDMNDICLSFVSILDELTLGGESYLVVHLAASRSLQFCVVCDQGGIDG
jgi:hypothetical protein